MSLKEIARIAGTSVSTVSRVLNSTGIINAKILSWNPVSGLPRRKSVIHQTLLLKL